MKKQHVKKCLTLTPPYHGEARNFMGDEFCDCDGYHTFDELYAHRIELFIALCKLRTDYIVDAGQYADVWRSKKHSDGSQWDGWFLLGIGKEKGEQITYHLPLSKWNECDFAETLNQAPEFDGHTSDDVLTRLKFL